VCLGQETRFDFRFQFQLQGLSIRYYRNSCSTIRCQVVRVNTQARLRCRLRACAAVALWGTSRGEQRADIAAAMHHVQNQHHVILYDAMNDQIAVHRKTAQAGPPIISRTAQIRMLRSRARCRAICHQVRLRPPAQGENRSCARMLFGIEAGHATPFDVIGQLPSFFRRRHASAFAACEGCFRFIDCNQNFESASLTLFPQLLIGGKLNFHAFSA
jgi:hypothetical protein